MGLDNYWKLPKGVKHPKIKISLCGGMLSDNGIKSFRGKVYNEFIKDLTGYSLYKEELSSDDVKEIADILHEKILLNREFYSQEAIDLAKMFSEYAKLDASLISWC